MGKVIHFEIHASEPEVAAEFYRALFGWSLQRWGDQPYWVIDAGAGDEPGINGGLLQRHGPPPAEGQPVTSFVCTVAVDSVDDTLVRGVELGGSLALPKMAVPGIGWLGYLKDPDGNILGVMQQDASAA
jgi:predicted enzyme related to lactoylglutathione lyase